MSCITLLCADHPLPPNGPKHDSEDCFSIQPLAYYRSAVEDLGLSMKPCRYELNLCPTEEAALLRAYLAQNCAPGETVELWQLWVGDGPGKPTRFSGPLADLDGAALEQLEERPMGQSCLTIRI